MTELSNRAKADALMARLDGQRNYPDKVASSEILLHLKGQVGPGRPVNATRVRAALERHPSAPLRIILDSPGGNLVEAERIASAILAHRGPTRAEVHKRCDSAAVHIFLACEQRFCGTGARFLIHEPELAPERQDRWTADRHRKIAAHIERANQRLIAFYHSRTGRPRSELAREVASERDLTPTDACRLGIVHAYWFEPNHPIQNRAAFTASLPSRAVGRAWPIF